MAVFPASTEFFEAKPIWPHNRLIYKINYFYCFLFIYLHFFGKSLYFALMKSGSFQAGFRIKRDRHRWLPINPKRTRRVKNEECLRHVWSTHFG